VTIATYPNNDPHLCDLVALVNDADHHAWHMIDCSHAAEDGDDHSGFRLRDSALRAGWTLPYGHGRGFDLLRPPTGQPTARLLVAALADVAAHTTGGLSPLGALGDGPYHWRTTRRDTPARYGEYKVPATTRSGCTTGGSPTGRRRMTSPQRLNSGLCSRRASNLGGRRGGGARLHPQLGARHGAPQPLVDGVQALAAAVATPLG